MKNKKSIQLTEADLHNIVADATNNILNEIDMGQQQPQLEQGQQQNNNQPLSEAKFAQWNQTFSKAFNNLYKCIQQMNEQIQFSNRRMQQINDQNEFISRQIQSLRR